jgi:lipopolysaccharide export system protein LptC
MTAPLPTESRLDRLVGGPRNAGGGHRYSNMVRSLRLLLPLLAGALLLLAVIWPQLDWKGGLDQGDLPRSLQDLGRQDVTMVAARLVGTDGEGRPFTLTATEARQADGLANRVQLQQPHAEILLEDGKVITLSADRGEYDRKTERMELIGHVVLVHGLGYRLETEAATVVVPEARAYGDRPVAGTGPSGELSGSGFEVLDKGQTVRVLGRSRLLLSDPAKVAP